MSRLTPDQILATLAGKLAALQSDALFQLKNDAADLLSAAKAIVDHLERALELKYADRAHALRLATGTAARRAAASTAGMASSKSKGRSGIRPGTGSPARAPIPPL